MSPPSEQALEAAVRFEELAARTQRVLYASSRAEGEEADALVDEVDTLTGELDDMGMASLHLMFGIDLPVPEFGEVVCDGLRNALGVRIRLLRDGPPDVPASEWVGVREDFDRMMEEIGLRRMDFTEAARSEVFLQPRHKYATWRPWNRR
jgi:hypothetical protein